MWCIPHAGFSYSRPGDFYAIFYRCKTKETVASRFDPCCTVQQQIYSAQQTALEGEGTIEPVSLRRDQNHQITAVTVNGILLNQLQTEYSQQLLQCATAYPIRLSVADLLGSKWLSWLPGGISFTLHPVVTWDAEVISRTFSDADSTRCFQVILVTNSDAAVFPWQRITLQDELILFEAVLYHTAG